MPGKNIRADLLLVSFPIGFAGQSVSIDNIETRVTNMKSDFGRHSFLLYGRRPNEGTETQRGVLMALDFSVTYVLDEEKTPRTFSITCCAVGIATVLVTTIQRKDTHEILSTQQYVLMFFPAAAMQRRIINCGRPTPTFRLNRCAIWARK